MIDAEFDRESYSSIPQTTIERELNHLMPELATKSD
jgi:hypothetical protein